MTIADQSLWRDAVALAISAPSVRNVQPWRFRLCDEGLELHLAAEASRSAGDATMRTVTISCGVVLHHLVVALRAAGMSPVVELLEEPGPDALLARIIRGTPHGPTEEDRRLAAAIQVRHTQRAPFDARRLRGELLDRLAVAAADQGGFLDVLRGARRDAACRLLDAADRSLAAQAPVLAVLSTVADGVRDQVEAGQALSAVVLEAATEGCAAGFLDGPLRQASSRARLGVLLRRGEVPMLLLRIGHAPRAAPASRRRLEDLLETPVAPD